jgi:hypothetical protein
MTLDGEAERLAYELAKLTGQPVEQAVMQALRDQLADLQKAAPQQQAVRTIQK